MLLPPWVHLSMEGKHCFCLFLNASHECHKNASVALWDMLLPNASNRIVSFDDAESAQYVTYSTRNQLLFAGGRKGKISVYDVRACKLLNTLSAHETSVRGLGIAGDHFLVSASKQGELKLWDLNHLQKDATSADVSKWTSQLLGVHESLSSELGGGKLGVVAVSSHHKYFELECIGDRIYTSHDGTFAQWGLP
jgi:WD40 repeat protein